MSRLKKLLGEGHYEGRRGSRDQARRYCMKKESQVSKPIEHGTWISGQGNRADIESIKSMVLEGKDDEDIFIAHPGTWLSFHAGISKIRRIIQRKRVPRWRKLKVIWLYGDTGQGKTRGVFDRHPDVYRLPLGDQQQLWFDGYDGENVIVFDEFYGQVKFNFMLQLLDGYPLRLPVKGDHVYANWTIAYITSQHPPEEVYNNIAPDLKGHLYRRIAATIHVPDELHRLDSILYSDDSTTPDQDEPAVPLPPYKVIDLTD